MKRVALIILTCLLTAGARAQEFKILIGVGSSTYSRMWAPEYWWDWSAYMGGFSPFKNIRAGIVGGFGVEIPLSGRLVLEADALYFSKGATFRQKEIYQQDPPEWDRIRKEFSLQGFAVPVLARVKLFSRPYPYVIIGIDLSFCTSHMLREYHQADIVNPYFYLGQTYQLVHETRTFDWGPILGIGYEIALPMAVLELEIRYQAGIPAINLEPGVYRARTRSIFLVAGFKI